MLASVAAAIDHVLGERKRRISGQMDGRLVTRESQRAVWLGETEYRLEVNARTAPSRCAFRARAKTPAAICNRTGSRATRCGPERINSQPVAVQVRPVPNGFALAYRGVEAKAFVYTESEAGYARLMPPKKVADTGKQVLCPMPGLVVSIAVKEGQEVKAGETVAVVEAMKMENVLRAEIDGTVKKINAKPGDSLAVDAVILEFA